MSKQGKRKITVDLPKTKDLANRPSVFERLGTKKASAKKTIENCRQWVQNGTCAYGKNCKFASTHTLISPSKQRAANKDSDQKRSVKDDIKSRLHSTVVVRRGSDGEIDNWDQNDLEYADTDVLEKRRLQLQRELELQLKMDSGKDMRKDKKKAVSSSSSSRSSSSSSASSSSSDGSSSSSSSGREARRKTKKGKLKRNSSSSSDRDVPSKKKNMKSDSSKKDKNDSKKSTLKKDDKGLKKHESNKKKVISKGTIGKKSLSPGKKSGGTPPITSKSAGKSTQKHSKSPPRRDRNRSVSPHSAREKERDRKERDKEREKDRDKERDRARGRSRSPKKGRSRSPRRHESHSKDARRKESSERSRPVSPKKPVRRDGSAERHRKKSNSRDRGRDHKDRSTERRKEKHDEKDRHERKDRGRDRKDVKRDDVKRRGRDRGLGGGRGGSDKGLEKPNKPMERLLPRPEERLAALAAISNRVSENDKTSSPSKDRQDVHSERSRTNKERLERDMSSKRDRVGSIDRDQADYDISMDRQYDQEHDRYNRVDERYEGGPRSDRSPGYGMPGRDRHYDPGYDMPGPTRGYPEDNERIYGDHMGDHRGEMSFEDRRPHRDRSWERRRSGSMDRERGYIHPHNKDWDNEDFRASGDWGRDRHWGMHETQMNEWGDKDHEMEGWHHRGHMSGPHRGRMREDYGGRGMRMDMGRGDKRRGPRNESESNVKETPPPAPAPVVAPTPNPSRQETENDDKPIPDDLSEISDDPDDILNREDMIEQTVDEDSQSILNTEESVNKLEAVDNQSTQDTSGAGEENHSQEINDEDAHLDFEEISDGELEEERTRAGLGDALGVDWASLVADVRRREQSTPVGGARDRWRPENVLARLGLSVHMAGKNTIQDVLQKNAETKDPPEKIDGQPIAQNGEHDHEEKPKEPAPDVSKLHPVAAIQVAVEKRKRQRAVLFGSGCEITRGLSARRDLALRRYLCHLPVTERTGQARVAPQSSLFQAARALLVQAPAKG